jgi:hypothetical protein
MSASWSIMAGVALRLAPYLEQLPRWPAAGRVILAQYDDEAVIVYQAYRPEIGGFAAKHGRFGAGWSRERMSWIKPNFLWMMHRCGWGEKEGQEVVLALRLRRAGFAEILASAVSSAYDPAMFTDQAAWKAAVARSDVRLQWDPDHAPGGAKEQRRAVQLGLRGEALRRFADEWLLEIEDVTRLVHVQRENARPPFRALLLPEERVYPVTDPATARRLGVEIAD